MDQQDGFFGSLFFSTRAELCNNPTIGLKQRLVPACSQFSVLCEVAGKARLMAAEDDWIEAASCAPKALDES